MALSPEDVKHIANLARLEITEDQIPVFQSKLTTILDMVDQLSQTNMDGVVPMAHPLNMAQRLRIDEVSEDDKRELYQENAPKTEAGLYLVPKVIE